MGILKAGIYSTIATAAKLLSSLLIVKLVAWYAGPEGVGKLGQFLSLMSLVSVFAGGGIASGIIKYVAEYHKQEKERLRFIQSSTGYTLIATSALGLLTVAFSKPLSLWLLGDQRFHSLILIVAAAQILIAGHNLILALINGFMDVRRVALINIIGSGVGLSLTALLVFIFQLDGALYAVVIGQAAMFCVSYPVLRRSQWFNLQFFRPKIDWPKYRLLAHYSLMTLTSAAIAPIVQIGVRNHLASHFSWAETGYWQAVSKVSDAYLLSITMAISVYYLPKLSSIMGKKALISELKSAYYYIMPVVICFSISIYLLREFLTVLLFSKEFLAGQELFAPQLIGDVIKIASFILSYLMLAKAMTKTFILSEIIFGLTYFAWVWTLTAHFGLIGVVYAFVVNYGLYLIFNILVVKIYLRNLP